MQSAVESQTEIRIINSEAVTHAIDKLQVNNPDTVITPEIAEQLRPFSGADAILRFRITDYGVTAKAWRHGVLVFEVASTLAIAEYSQYKSPFHHS